MQRSDIIRKIKSLKNDLAYNLCKYSNIHVKDKRKLANYYTSSILATNIYGEPFTEILNTLKSTNNIDLTTIDLIAYMPSCHQLLIMEILACFNSYLVHKNEVDYADSEKTNPFHVFDDICFDYQKKLVTHLYGEECASKLNKKQANKLLKADLQKSIIKNYEDSQIEQDIRVTEKKQKEYEEEQQKFLMSSYDYYHDLGMSDEEVKAYFLKTDDEERRTHR